MKIKILILALLGATTSFSQSSNFSLQPSKPQPGDVVKFTYTAPAGFATDKELLRCDAYKFGFYDEPMKYGAKPLNCELVKLVKNGNTYTGELKTDAETRFVAFAFTVGNVRFKSVSGKVVLVSGKVDTNNDNGYSTVLYDASGKEANASLLFAGLYYGGNFYNNIQISNKKLSNQFFARQIEQDSTYRVWCKSYEISGYVRTEPETAKKMAQAEVERAFQHGMISEDDYLTATQLYFAGFPNGQKYFAKQGIEKFGKANSFIQAMAMKDEFWKTTDIEKIAVLAKQLTDFYAKADWKVRFFTLATSNYTPDAFNFDYIAALAKAGRADEVVAALKNKNLFPYFYGGLVAWRSVSKPLIDQKNPKVPELLADQEKFVKARYESLKKNPEQPAASPDEECVTTTGRFDFVTVRYMTLQQQYAQYYYNTGEYEKGYPYIKLAYAVGRENGMDSQETNGLYLQYAEKLAPKEQKGLIESFVKAEAYKPEMKDKLKEIYVAEKGSDAGFDNYFSGLRGAEGPKLDLKEIILSTKIDQPAPKFSLQDLDGKTVSLESLKGKTVILDFWATWCGPCIASFPAMLKLRNAYASSKDVEVIFVNTWERNVKSSDELKQRVKKFTIDKKFDFNPLLDEKGEVVGDFGIQGIPTKVVIDKAGNIRYKITGAETDQDKLLEEMKIMIESLK